MNNIKLLSLIIEQQKKNKFNFYRKTILDKYKIDIKDLSMNEIDGGLAKNMKIWEITTIPLKEIIKGINVQFEHTPDASKAIEIALDHLYGEDKFYYTHLAQMVADNKNKKNYY